MAPTAVGVDLHVIQRKRKTRRDSRQMLDIYIYIYIELIYMCNAQRTMRAACLKNSGYRETKTYKLYLYTYAF